MAKVEVMKDGEREVLNVKNSWEFLELKHQLYVSNAKSVVIKFKNIFGRDTKEIIK